MISLENETQSSIDITSETVVQTYTASRDAVVQVLVKLTGIAGNGDYEAAVYLDDVLIAPKSTVSVPNGVTSAYFSSQQFPLASGTVLKLKLKGLASDTSIDTDSTVYDVGFDPVNQVIDGKTYDALLEDLWSVVRGDAIPHATNGEAVTFKGIDGADRLALEFNRTTGQRTEVTP